MAEAAVSGRTQGKQAVGALKIAKTLNEGYPIMTKQVLFTETDGAGAYTGTIALPAGATILDILIEGIALWDNSGAVDMDVGIAGTVTMFFDITSLKTGGDLVANETLSIHADGGETGTAPGTRYAAAARDILGKITTASTGGSTGRTRMTVIYSLPAAGAVAAVKA